MSAAERGGGARTPKGEATRRHILETALAMFRQRGYEDTTMRGIASAAGVATGNAYYYFRSKEHLIQGFYERSNGEHLEACESVLDAERDFKARLRGVLVAKIDTSMPYHRFAGLLFKSAADPASPLSPFSPESAPVRRDATDLMQRVIRDSRLKVAPGLAPELPNLLWLYLMGIILFWIHDTSTDCERTYRLIDRTVEVVSRLATLAGNPLLRPLVKSTISLLTDLRALEGRAGRSTSPA